MKAKQQHGAAWITGYNAGTDARIKSYHLVSMQSSLLRQGRSTQYVDECIAGFIAGRKELEQAESFTYKNNQESERL